MSEYIYGRKINDISEIYKGDGITTCKFCGDTGMMHTFSNDGYFYNDAPCFCKHGQEKMKRNEQGEMSTKLDLRITWECPHCGQLTETSFWDFEVIFNGTSFQCNNCKRNIVVELYIAQDEETE